MGPIAVAPLDGFVGDEPGVAATAHAPSRAAPPSDVRLVLIRDAQRQPITPNLGQVIQGYLGGDISDLRDALKKLSDANEADREQAMTAAKSGGAEVSMDDYAFTDWKPGADYVYR